MTDTSLPTAGLKRSKSAFATTIKLALLATVAVVIMAPASGCGGKPDFCADRTTLENSVKDLPSTATKSGVSGLQAQLTQIEADAKALIDSAKSDFPSETNAIESSIDQFKTSVENLPDTPTAAHFAAIGLNASAVVNSVKAFMAATEEACK